MIRFRSGLLALTLLVSMVTCNLASAEPVVSGLPLSAWLARLGQGSDGDRADAASRLGKFGPMVPGVREALTLALDDPSCAEAAVEAIASWGVESHPLLLEVLRRGIAPARTAAARSLGKVDPSSKEIIVGLQKALSDTDETVRWEAAMALSKIAPGQARHTVGVLVQALEIKPNPKTPHLQSQNDCSWLDLPFDRLVPNPNLTKEVQTLEALRRLGSLARAAAPALMQLVKKPSVEGQITATAIRVLARVCVERPFEVEPFLEEMLYRPRAVDRLAAAEALAFLGRRDEAVLLTLVHGLEFHTTRGSRFDGEKEEDPTTMAALVRIGAPAIPYLVDVLDDPHEPMSAGAARVLAQLDDLPDFAIAGLRQALESENKATQRWAAQALVRYPKEAASARLVLVEALADWGGKGWSRWNQGTTFDWHKEVASRLQSAEAIPDLIRGLEEGTSAVKMGCAAHLGTLGAPARKAIPALRKYLNHDDKDVAAWAAVALGELGEDVADQCSGLLMCLIYMTERNRDDEIEVYARGKRAWEVLRSSGPSMRKRLMEGLKEKLFQDKRAEILAHLASLDGMIVPALTKALDHQDSQTRCHAAMALELIGEAATPAASRLKALLKDEDKEVRLQAAKALWAIKGKADEVLPTLIACLNSDHKEHAHAALQALAAMGPEARPALPQIAERVIYDTPNLDNPYYAEPLYRVAANGAAAMAEALRSDNDQTRQVASAYLARLGPVSLGPLIHLLGDVEPTVRKAAASALAALGDDAKPAIPALRWTLCDGSLSVALEAVCTLAMIDGEREALLPVLRQGLGAVDPADRLKAVTTIILLGSGFKTLVPDLRRALRDPDAAVRASVATALGKLGEEARDAIDDVTALLQDHDSSVRNGATQGLAYFATYKIQTPAMTRALVGALRDADSTVRSGAAKTLAVLLPDPALTVPALVEALNDSEKEVAARASTTLESYPERALPQLMAALNHPQELVRRKAVRLISMLGNKPVEVVPLLTAHLSDSDDEVREWAAAALAGLGPKAKEAIPALIEAARDPHDAVRGNALAALVNTKATGLEVMTALGVGLADPEHSHRETAARGLGTLGPLPPSARALLERAARDGHAGVRWSAARALLVQGKDAVEELRSLSEENNPDLRALAAAVCLDQKPCKEFMLPYLTKALSDPHENVRAAAARAIGSLGPTTTETLDSLRRLTRMDTDAAVRAAAAEALGRLHDYDATVVLKEAVIDDQNAEVRQGAAEALRKLRR